MSLDTTTPESAAAAGLEPTATPPLHPHQSEPQRLDYLDSVRGLAAVSVVGWHYATSYGFPGRLWSSTPLVILWDGTAAVSLFFILSGFVLSLRHFLHSTTADFCHFSYPRYIIARVFRLWPPFAVAVVLSTILERVLAAPGPSNPAAHEWIRAFWIPHRPLANVLSNLNLTGFGFTLVPQAWSLTVELILSLAVPAAVFLFCRNVWLRALLLILTIITPFLNMPPLAHYGFHFALGIFVAQYHVAIRRFLEPRVWLRLALLLSGIFLYTFRHTVTIPLVGLQEGPAHLWTWRVTGIGAVCLIMYVLGSMRMRLLLTHPVLVFCGRISYSVYLLHIAVLICITPRFMHKIISWGPERSWPAGLAFTIAATLTLATAFYFLVEIPSIWVGRRLGTLMARARIRL